MCSNEKARDWHRADVIAGLKKKKALFISSFPAVWLCANYIS